MNAVDGEEAKPGKRVGNYGVCKGKFFIQLSTLQKSNYLSDRRMIMSSRKKNPLQYVATFLSFLFFFNCSNNNSNLIATPVWGGFYKNIRLAHNSQAKSFPGITMPANVFSGATGEGGNAGWAHSISPGPWDSITFRYSYNDSLPSLGISATCSLQSIVSQKNPNVYYKNIDIRKWISSNQTDTIHAPDSRITVNGIAFDESVPLYAADNGEPIDKSKITARHAISFALSWSTDTLSAEMHWADYTGMRPPPPLLP
jgi:hypothetical protein